MKRTAVLLTLLLATACSSPQLSREVAERGMPPVSDTKLWAVEYICENDASQCNAARAKVGLPPLSMADFAAVAAEADAIREAFANRRARALQARYESDYRRFRWHIIRKLED